MTGAIFRFGRLVEHRVAETLLQRLVHKLIVPSLVLPGKVNRLGRRFVCRALLVESLLVVLPVLSVESLRVLLLYSVLAFWTTAC